MEPEIVIPHGFLTITGAFWQMMNLLQLTSSAIFFADVSLDDHFIERSTWPFSHPLLSLKHLLVKDE